MSASNLAGLAGFEPASKRLGNVYFVLLSYKPKFESLSSRNFYWLNANYISFEFFPILVALVTLAS